jgi:hypothetical protein
MLMPFRLWEVQQDLIRTMELVQLLLMLKTRQIGCTWLACLFALRLCTLVPGQPVLMLSKGQLEANEMVRRVSLMHHHHEDARDTLPRLITDNTADLEWDNGSRVISLAATRGAGRSFTGALVILDEWAFMKWPQATLAAVKPTIDAGGKLFIISSADGANTPYHQFWNAAEAHQNGYTPFFIPWYAHPERGPSWRDEKLRESNNDTATIYREYPANPLEAFTNAAGLVYDVWSDGPPDCNVTEAAEYIPDGGPILWALDDGYSAGSAGATAGRDPSTGHYVADSHPRVILWMQQRPDGRLCVFNESYACLLLSDAHLATALTAPYPAPDFVAHGPGSAEIRGRIHAAGLYARQSTADVEESIKETRRALAPDANSWRRILVHPRCTELRSELASYRRDAATGKVIKAFDHGPDALRGLVWVMRHGI